MSKVSGRVGLIGLSLFVLGAGLAEAAPAAAPAFKGEFVKVPKGTFTMGCGAWQTGCDAKERPEYKVTVNAFELGAHEVTQEEWKSVMGKNPSHFVKCGENCPVEQVSWDDVQAFIAKLNRAKGTCKYRLPTEVEWEYACRSGGKETYCGGKDVNTVAWWQENSEGTSHPVKLKAPNGLGLYDMSGNVYEWVADKYRDSYAKTAKTSSELVFRGGSFGNGAENVRSTSRFSNGPTYKYNDLGFRLARTCR